MANIGASAVRLRAPAHRANAARDGAVTVRRFLALGVIALYISPQAAPAASYPVAGRWTYDHAAENGPAKNCGARKMEFQGERRLDSVGGVPEYRNLSVAQTSASSYQVVDEFFTVQIRGRMEFTLRIIDPDHIEIHLVRAGKTFMLRRCA
jgi:hypothetical protein